MFASFANTKKNVNLETKKTKILIVYYSLTGNTRHIINKIQKWLNNTQMREVDIEELKTPMLSNTMFSYIKIAILSLWEGDIAIEPTRYDVKKYDHIIICCPFWMGIPALPLQTYLKDKTNDIKPSTKIHSIITYGGSSIHVLLQAIEHLEHTIDKKFTSNVFIQSEELNSVETNNKLLNFTSSIQ